MKRSRVLSFVLAIVMGCMLGGGVMQAQVQLPDIRDHAAGETLHLGGMASSDVDVYLYLPGEEEPWFSRRVSIRPDHIFNVDIHLPEFVVGELQIIVEDDFSQDSRTFQLVESLDVPQFDDQYLLSLLTGLQSPSPALAGDEMELWIDGKLWRFSVPPTVVQDVVMIPLGDILGALGARVDRQAQEVTVIFGLDTIHAMAGRNVLLHNGSQVNLAQPAMMVDDTLLVPLGVLQDTLGIRADWDPENDRIIIGSKERAEWWFSFPTKSETAFVDATDARLARHNYGADFLWGTLAQRLSYIQTQADLRRRIREGRRVISYMEAMGEGRTYAVGYRRNEDGSFPFMLPDPVVPRPDFNAWQWQEARIAAADYITYVGIHTTINDEDIVVPSYTREALGLNIPRYPDGREALGYLDNDLPFPLNAALYDAHYTKTVDGYLTLRFGRTYEGTTTGLAGLKVGSPYLPRFSGKRAGDMVHFLDIYYSADPASPFWAEYYRVTAREFMTYDLDGAWFDNMSLWNNFFDTNNSYGEWSEYRFNIALADRFSPEELEILGIDLGDFRISEYVRTRNIPYASDRWLDDPIWNLYKVFKSEAGRSTLQDLYQIMKEEAELAGRTDGFAVFGNDMPHLNHGWIEDGWLDMVGSELSYGWSLGFGTRGIMLPPVGKMAIMYRTMLEHQSGPFPVVWLYLDGDQNNQTELGKVLLSEAFANNTFVKQANNTAGTHASHRWLNDFVHSEEENLSPRYPHYDIGLVFSPANQLGNQVPARATGPDMDAQYHAQGHWGFAHALVDAHVPYRVIPDWKINGQVLQGLSTLIFPHAECLDDEILPILKEFVEQGGRLVLTGPAGLRHGYDGYFMPREEALLSELVGRDISGAPSNRLSTNPMLYDTAVYANSIGKGEVVWTAMPMGHFYFQQLAHRATFLPRILDLVGGTGLFDGSELPSTVGAFLWRSTDGQVVFVDLVNYQIDVKSDQVTPATDLSFRVNLADTTDSVDVWAIRPEGNVPLESVIEDGWVTIVLPDLTYYTSVRIAME